MSKNPENANSFSNPSGHIFDEYGYNARSYFLGASAGNSYNRRFSDSELEVLPGVRTDDTYARFLKDLHTNLVNEFQDGQIVRGWFTNPIQSNKFSKLLTMPGTIRPLNYGSANLITQDVTFKELPAKFLSSIEKVVQVRYGVDKKEYDVRIARDSSSGAPFFRHDVDFKLSHLGILTHHLDALAALDFTKLWNECRVVFLSNAQVRLQADEWKGEAPKPRAYTTYVDSHCETASEDLSKGYPASDLLRDYSGVKLGTCRTRVVRAFPSIINYVLTSFLVDLRDSADNYFSFTYKHRGPEDILSKIEGSKYCFGIDVSQYDASISYDMFKCWLSNLPLNEVKKNIIDVFSRCPFYTSETHQCDGDPMNLDTFSYWAGLPSGVAYTSMIGKDIMTATMLYALQMATKQDFSTEYVSNLLKGELSVKFLNQSDDSIIMAEENSLIEDIFGYMNDIFKIEPEDGLLFLGNLGYIDANGRKNICPNLVSYFEKIYVPERSIYTKFRPYPIFGIKERRLYYSKHPYFDRAREIEQDIFKSVYGIDLDYIENINYKSPPITFMNGELSSADIDVLNSPERLWYKYDLDDIKPEIVNMFISKMPDSFKEKFNSIGECNG